MLIKLIKRPMKGWCENKFCGDKLKGAFKVFQRGRDGYKYYVCLGCFKHMARKSHSNFGRYIPDEQITHNHQPGESCPGHEGATQIPYAKADGTQPRVARAEKDQQGFTAATIGPHLTVPPYAVAGDSVPAVSELENRERGTQEPGQEVAG